MPDAGREPVEEIGQAGQDEDEERFGRPPGEDRPEEDGDEENAE